MTTPAETNDDVNPIVQRLEAALDESRRTGEAVGLLLVHAAAVDRIDALHGFHAGDRMSANISQVLKTQALRKRDIVEQLSRDEFACLLRPASSEGIAMLGASRIMTMLAAPMQFGITSIAPDAAVGIAMFPRQAKDASELLQRAKHALQSARGHRDRVWLYAEPADAAAVVDQLEYENRLRGAIEQNRLMLYFQPQADIRTGRIIGAEALLRWDDATLGFVPPNVAVKAAESAGLIDHLTMWVITSGIQSCAEFRKLDPAFHISLNISPSNLREVDLPYYVDRALRTWNVPGENIMVEITESAMMVEQTAAHEALHQLKTHGVQLSVDDFGTGYSSMYYLAQLPLDELKIDLMFVKNMLEAPQHAKIVRSLIDLAHNLELTVVAEGVESEEILAALAHLGCDIAQGYYIGRPLTNADMTARLMEQNRLSA